MKRSRICTASCVEFVEKMRKGQKASKRKLKVLPVEDLNENQRKAFELVKNNNESVFPEQLKLILAGKAGTGKTITLNTIRDYLESNGKVVATCSFTGKSAFLVNGSTFHSTFCLPINFNKVKPGTNINAVREKLQGVDYFLFDELSLLGLNLFGYISLRMQAIYGNNLPLGGRSCIIAGDYGQLRPVGDYSIFSDVNSSNSSDSYVKAGQFAYKSFQNAVILNEIMRTSNENQEFKRMQERFRMGEILDSDIEKLKTREISIVSAEERRSFFEKNPITLYADKSDALEYNKMSKLPREKVVLKGCKSKSAPGSADTSITLCIGARVFLNHNLYIEAGLFNGATGTVTEIGPSIRNKPPEYVFVKFDEVYLTEIFLLRDDIPIPMIKTFEFCSVTRRCWSKTQFPLELAFAMTIHKYQGQGSDALILGLPELGKSSMMLRESPAAFFVGFSRATSMKNLILKGTFQRAFVQNKGGHFFAWTKEEERLKLLA